LWAEPDFLISSASHPMLDSMASSLSPCDASLRVHAGGIPHVLAALDEVRGAVVPLRHICYNRRERIVRP